MSDSRIRDFGFNVGELPCGARNAITDVAGVKVGHCTIAEGEHQTGVTVILPCEKNIFTHKLPAASYVLNGFGKTLGLVQVDELGSLETPIAITNTLNVGLVHDALVDYTVKTCAAQGVKVRSVNPVVCECNDSSLNDICDRAVKSEHVYAAIESAEEDFAQGAVGAGRGTICYGFKGGIGSSSRVIELDGEKYTVGVLVQTNMGSTKDLTVCGRNVGREVLDRCSGKIEPSVLDKGSIIMILATDIPCSDRQLRRIIKRMAVGLTRTGSHLGHGSGDIMVGFSTAYTLAGEDDKDIVSISVMNENVIEEAFRAAAEATEEAILNSLAAADDVTGFEGHTRYSLAQFL